MARLAAEVATDLEEKYLAAERRANESFVRLFGPRPVSFVFLVSSSGFGSGQHPRGRGYRKRSIFAICTAYISLGEYCMSFFLRGGNADTTC